MVMDDPTLPRIKVRDLLMQAFLTGWTRSDKAVSQDEYLQSSIQVIEMLQVEPENLYAEGGPGLPDGEEVDHLDDLLRADGVWLYYGVEAENFFRSSGTRMRCLPTQSSSGPAGRTGRRQAVSGGPDLKRENPHRPKTSAIPTRCSSAPDHFLPPSRRKGENAHAAFYDRTRTALCHFAAIR